MKRLALSTLLSVTASTLIAPAAHASGWIMIDPIVGGVAPPVMTPPSAIHTVTPIIRPGHTPRPRSIVLQGQVSFGLHLQSEAVKVEIKDQVAKTYITQTFENDTDRNLAGTYLFPLPDDTTFSSFSLHIDGKPVEGKILEANAARQEYEAIVRRMVDPGLLEYADSKTVRARIFPIPAHGTKKVELEYTQLLKAENGLLKYRFPLKSKVQDTPPEEIKIDLKLASNQGLRTIWSPTHVISANRSDNNNAKISMLEKETIPDKDFLLYYSVSNTEMAANLITHKAEGEDGYFLLTLSPPLQAKNVIGKDVVLVADTSGSMQGEKMEENKRALKYVVNALHPSDRFGVVEFNTDAETFKSELVEATGANKKAACEFIDELSARGGTNIGEAISIGKTLLSEVSPRPAYMIFMTDGEPTVGERDSEKLISIANSKKDIRVFDFGIGYDINTKLLNKLAESHHGTSQYVEPDENIETAISSFYEKIKSPVLSDVKLAYTDMEVKNVYPKEVKDIFAGSQVLLLGRYKKGGNTSLNLTGKVNGVAKNFSFPINFASTQAGNSHLVKLWAMRRIGYLTEVAHANQENKEVIDEIIALSQKHGIISEYTSYLVTDPSENHRLATNIPRPRMVRRPAASPMLQANMAPGLSNFGGFSGGSGDSEGSVRGAFFKGDRGSYTGRKVQIAGDVAQVKSWDASAVSGKQAVRDAKVNNKLKEGEVLIASNYKDQGLQQLVGEKTFKMIGSTWVDTSYNEHTASKPKVIVFGSQGYFDLLKDEPGITKYLSVGKELIVTFNGKTYKIVQSRNATG